MSLISSILTNISLILARKKKCKLGIMASRYTYQYGMAKFHKLGFSKLRSIQKNRGDREKYEILTNRV